MYICLGCHQMLPNIDSLLEYRLENRLGCQKSDDDDFSIILNSIYYFDDNDDDIVLQAELPVQAELMECKEHKDNLTSFLNALLFEESDDDIEGLLAEFLLPLSLPKVLLAELLVQIELPLYEEVL
ncbi:hypothetical protein QYF36_026242 [Acer negundo]|nr:hypothetical protein QYF36_026242 [Acer negundo]